MEHLKFNRWATNEILTAAARLGADARTADRNSSFGGIQSTLTHLYQADRVWLDRLNGVATFGLDRYVASEDFQEFSANWLEVLDEYVALGQSWPEADWDRQIAYKNLRGESFQNTIGHILLHLVNHGSYHRGQVVTMLRQAGAPAPTTDLIHFYRAVSRP